MSIGIDEIIYVLTPSPPKLIPGKIIEQIIRDLIAQFVQMIFFWGFLSKLKKRTKLILLN